MSLHFFHSSANQPAIKFTKNVTSRFFQRRPQLRVLGAHSHYAKHKRLNWAYFRVEHSHDTGAHLAP
jgi:hypothetical protein